MIPQVVSTVATSLLRSVVMFGLVWPSCATGHTMAAHAAEVPHVVMPFASHTSGTAPLTVFFDARAVTQNLPHPFRDAVFSWSFGDPAAGSWKTTGRNANTATGPVTAHIFLVPGRYVVQLTIRPRHGPTTHHTVTILVTDPNIVFAGHKTMCFSPRGDFAGCPAGSRKLRTPSFPDIIDHARPGTRLLLHRGETFRAPSVADLDVGGPGLIGAYGQGPRPVVLSSAAKTLRLSGNPASLDDWRITELEFRRVAPGGVMIWAEGRLHDVLFYHLAGRDFHVGIGIAANLPAYYHQPMHDGVAVVACDIEHVIGDAGGYGIFVSARHLAVLGNHVADTRNAEHVLRIQFTDPGVIADNDLGEPAMSKHVLKLHAFDAPQLAHPMPSAHFVLADNIFRAGDSAWTVSIGPQNAQSNELVHTALIERNYFVAGPHTRIHLQLAASDIVVRNNIFNLTAAVAPTGVEIGRRGIEPPPRGDLVTNNTCYTGGTAPITCVDVDSSASHITTINNLLAAPRARSARVVRDDGVDDTQRGNLDTPTPHFVSRAPTQPDDFALTPHSPAVGRGSPHGGALDDYTGQPRFTGVAAQCCDVGAFELVRPASPPAEPQP